MLVSKLKKEFKTVLKDQALFFVPKILKELPDLKLYFVGGIVRDLLLGKQSKDFDFVAAGVPAEDLLETLRKYGKLDLVGKNFGVIKFTPNKGKLKESIDIALPRTDISKGTGGYRDFDAQTDYKLPIEKDLSRRDFSINALAWDLANEKLIDLFKGSVDLKKKIIRAVGDPNERFQEDYSRMLRALRFACQLDFQIETKTWKTIKKMIHSINDSRKNKQRIVPWEVIAQELLKMLAVNPEKAVQLLDESGALLQTIPEMLKLKGCEQSPPFHTEGDVWTHVTMMLKEATGKAFKKTFPKEKITGEFILAIILHDIGKPARQTHKGARISFKGHAEESLKIAQTVCQRLRLSNEQTKRILFIIQHHMFGFALLKERKVGASKISQRYLDSPYSQDLLKLFFLDISCAHRTDGQPWLMEFDILVKKINQIKKIREKQPEKIITGEEIMKALGIKPSIFVGVVEAVLLELKDQGKVNSQKEAKAFLKKQKKTLLALEKKATLKNKEKVIEEILGRSLLSS